MKNWIKIICGLIVLGIVLFLLGKYNPLHMLNWLTGIVGTIVGVASLMYLDVNWGKFLDNTL